jgi:nucleoside 2-deoxyribosyltransferase
MPTRRPRAYLAGPDVFLPDARAVGERKVAICAAHGLDGHFPLDVSLNLAHLEPYAQGMAIYRANRDTMAACDLAFVNLTPFRGPSADVGTAFELGWLIAAGTPVFGYTSDPRLYAERVASDAYAVERHAMHDNLMLDAALAAQPLAAAREIVAIPEPPGGDPLAALAALAAFEAAVARAGQAPVG